MTQTDGSCCNSTGFADHCPVADPYTAEPVGDRMDVNLLGKVLDLSSKMQMVQRDLARVIRDEAYERGERAGYERARESFMSSVGISPVSFSIIKAGKLDDVKKGVANASVHDNAVGEAAKRLIAEVLELSGSEAVIIEASGHSGAVAGGHVRVSVSVRPVP